MKRVLISPNFWAYVKISEGCNNLCSYCTIPYIRGKLRSRRIEDIVKEVYSLVKNGAKEINLISQDTTRYGEDIYGEPSLLALLKELEKIKGDFYIRILYSYPIRITRDLVHFIKNSEKIVPYFEIPIQHVNDEILIRMNRNYTKEDIKRV
ncbi:MAG: radical SAM protein, partial [Dictyoglomus sp.]